MDDNFGFKMFVTGVSILVGVFVFLIFKPFTIVGAGQRGVVTHFGRVTGEVLGEGLHWYVPISTGIRKMDVRVQKDDVKAEAASNDLQTVNVDIVVNWHLEADKVADIYQRVGDNSDVLEKIVTPAVNEVAKASTAQKKAEEIISKRPELKDDIDTKLKERLTPYGIVLDDASLVNVDFSDEFNAAIEKKQVAQQEAQQSGYAKEKATNEALAAVEKARGESEAQRLQQSTLTPLLLQKLWIEKWSGGVPQVVGADNQLLFQLPTGK